MDAVTKFKERKLDLQLKEVEARVIYHRYDGVELNTTLVSFKEKRRVLSTMDGVKRVNNVANVYVPDPLSKKIMTMSKYAKFTRRLPATLGLRRSSVTLMSTGVDMDKLAFCEKTFEDFHVCCIATGGARNNALRMGVDRGQWIERETGFQAKPGTINIILLTNVTLTWGAMARAIIAATEAKTAALQDLDYRSTPSPQVQATGTGTDNMIVVSGVNPDIIIRQPGGHSKMGELIGFSAKTAVTDALKNFDFNRKGACEC
ncbi:MAG: adenosylcobinamide amidohydrolase [Candidatus Bathyarchaeota archaeon]|nr:adenosylcobinamide amidohydrolase [Candidatus Bathyarchaeota archaeon]